MERSKASMDTSCTKIAQLSKTVIKMQEENERLKGLVNSLETKLQDILKFGIGAYPHEIYFDTLKIAEDIPKTKVKVETTNWHINRTSRDRPILVSFASFMKKPEVFQSKRNLAGTSARIGEDFSIKVRETR
jgi:hypothetical protein